VTRALFVLALAAALPAVATDWPQFRGPTQAGTAPADADPPASWGDTKNLRWKTPLPGPGSSSPAVVGDRVFVTYYTGYGVSRTDPGDPAKLVRHLTCLGRTDGKVQWTADVPGVSPEDPYKGFINEHGYASSSPVCDGERVFVFFGKTGVLAFDLAGKQLWQTSVGTETDVRGWGSAASPVLYKNLVIVNAASEGRAVVGLDKATGKQVWKAEGKKLSLSFSTPALVKVDDSRTDLVVAMPNEVWGVNPDTGKMAWFATVKCGGGNLSASVTPGDGVAFVTGGFTSTGMACVRAGGKGDVTGTHVVWEAKQSSYVPTPALADGHLYWVSENGFANCADAATGKTLWEPERLAGVASGFTSKPVYASAVVAKGRVYAVTRKAGVFVLAAGPKFEQLARNTLADDTDFNGTPAVVGRQLFLRSNKALYCVEGD
jgi:outer membrane protein assembly factor BamB